MPDLKPTSVSYPPEAGRTVTNIHSNLVKPTPCRTDRPEPISTFIKPGQADSRLNPMALPYVPTSSLDTVLPPHILGLPQPTQPKVTLFKRKALPHPNEPRPKAKPTHLQLTRQPSARLTSQPKAPDSPQTEADEVPMVTRSVPLSDCIHPNPDQPHYQPIPETDSYLPPGPSPHDFAPIKRSFWPTLVDAQWHAHPEFALLYSAVRRTCLPNRLGARITIPTALNLANWDKALVGYHDKDLCDYLRFGWPVGYTLPNPPTPVSKNHSSATDHPSALNDYVKKELRLGGLLGPFSAPPFKPWFQVSPVMTAPKRDTLSRRIILDLSYPHGASVNSGITKNVMDGEFRPYTLPSIEDLVTKVTQLGTTAFLWKADMARAYHQLRVDVQDTPLLGFKVGNSYYVEVSPSFGSRLSASTCQRTTNAVVYLLAKKHHWSLSYLDDFAGAAPTYDLALSAYTDFLALAQHLGIQLSPEKCTPPTQVLEWLGFKLDVANMILTIPKDKLDSIVQECQRWLTAKAATRQDIQSLAGRLIHVSKCIPPGRRFMCRILNALRHAPDTGHIWLSAQLKADVRWFYQFASLSNGLHLLKPSLQELEVECDSSLTGGGGATATHFYSLVYPEVLQEGSPLIVQKEACNLLIAYRTLVPLDTAGHKVVIYTDNMASHHALQSGKSKDLVLGACARQLWLEAAINNHVIEVRHRPGKDLPLADALNRHNDPVKVLLAAALVKQRGLLRREPKLPHPMFSPI